MPSAIIYNLWIFTPWCFERKLDFVVQKPWVQTFDGRVELSVWIKSWRNYIIERARTEFHSLVAKLDVSKLVNKNLYVALWSNFYVLTDKPRKRTLEAASNAVVVNSRIQPHLQGEVRQKKRHTEKKKCERWLLSRQRSEADTRINPNNENCLTRLSTRQSWWRCG